MLPPPPLAPPPKGVLAVCDIRYWQQYFNISIQDLKLRLKSSLIPKSTGEFCKQVKEHPDLYGPFWIASFLVFMTVIGSSFWNIMARILVDNEKIAAHNYDFEKVGYTFILVYGFLAIFPTCLTLLLMCTSDDPPSNIVVNKICKPDR